MAEIKKLFKVEELVERTRIKDATREEKIDAWTKLKLETFDECFSEIYANVIFFQVCMVTVS